MVLYQLPSHFAYSSGVIVLGTLRLVGTYLAVTAMPQKKCLKLSISFHNACIRWFINPTSFNPAISIPSDTSATRRPLYIFRISWSESDFCAKRDNGKMSNATTVNFLICFITSMIFILVRVYEMYSFLKLVK